MENLAEMKEKELVEEELVVLFNVTLEMEADLEESIKSSEEH